MMVFGKQTVSEPAEKSSTVSTRTYHLSMNERRPDDSPMNYENSSSSIAKLYPVQQDNQPSNLSTRFDSGSFNRPQPIVREKFYFIT